MCRNQWVFVWAPEEEDPWPPGAASRWWLHQSVSALDDDLLRSGSRLVIRRGPALQALRALARETGAQAVFWNRRYEPSVRRRDEKIQASLESLGLDVQTFGASLLFEPGEILNQSGKPYQVFSQFWRTCLLKPEPAQPLAVQSRIGALRNRPQSVALTDLNLLPAAHWTGGLEKMWTPGAAGARKRLSSFVKGILAAYAVTRERPDQTGTSRLSPHLHFGEISPREVWHAVRKASFEGMGQTQFHSDKKHRAAANQGADLIRGEETFLRELGWREFAYHLLFHFSHTQEEPLRPNFRKFPWRRNAAALLAWQRGCTGYPIVDAGMRELWSTGWMHNRVRMIVASFLVKDLLISWQEGARWFWDTLVDADLANNTLGWQWSAGCGADAAPYFRIFNPVSQGERFDPEGVYVRRWIPELATTPREFIHRPWQAPASLSVEKRSRLGENYPRPLVDHAAAREKALEAYRKSSGN